MLNHATQRVNDAERDRGSAEIEHRIACVKHEASNAKVQTLQKEFKRAIAKSRYYVIHKLYSLRCTTMNIFITDAQSLFFFNQIYSFL